MSNDILMAAKQRKKGYNYEDFEVGKVFAHHWGRTLCQAENALFSTLTLHFNPTYTNREYAKAMGHKDTPINPLLIFNTVFGLSVQDLSETSTAFLGVEELVYHTSVYPGDTITTSSTVIARRPTSSNPRVGIATWHTKGYNQHEELVCEFKRTNRFNLRAPK